MISLVVIKDIEGKAMEKMLNWSKYNILESVPHDVSFRICLELKGH